MGPERTSQRVLVTGAAGFIGGHLTRALVRRGMPLRALDLHLDPIREFASAPNVELMEGDVADPEVQRRAVRGVGVVQHLAATHLGVAHSNEEFRRVNVDGARGLAEAAATAGVHRFIHCSTVGVYGQVRRPPANEESAPAPDFPYERTKLLGEAAVRDVAERTGLELVILRPVWIYGPGCQRTEKLVRAIRRGRFVVAGSGRAWRHSLFIDDMVEALRLAAEAAGAAGETLIVGDRQAVQVRFLIDQIARLTGSKRPPRVPLALMWMAATAAELACAGFRREPPISRRTLRFFTGNTAFDTAKARRCLDFEPHYDVRTGLAETLRRLGLDGAS